MAASSEDFWAKLGQTDSKALDQLYACNQASEILGRTRRIVDRIMPQKPTPHGFWDPEGFYPSKPAKFSSATVREKYSGTHRSEGETARPHSHPCTKGRANERSSIGIWTQSFHLSAAGNQDGCLTGCQRQKASFLDLG